ncbi:MAG: FHA domain-containing protein [Actinobacteria bacterium]|nr:FHA domain-containing protein [Actinomycetota bacterium]
MPEQLLTVLKLCLLALLYLFFLRVLRAVWTEVNPPKVAPTRKPAAPVAPSTRARRGAARARRKPAVPTRLVVVEPSARVGAEFALGPDLTVGRAPGCDLVFDEQYVSQVHTRIFSRDGAVFVEDLGSTNGTWVNGARAVGQMPARLGDRIQVGNVVMEVR